MLPIPDIMKMKMNAFGRPSKFKSGRRGACPSMMLLLLLLLGGVTCNF